YRVPLLVEELPYSPQQVDVFRPIVAAASPALERFDFRKLGFPEPQHMGWKVKFLRDFSVSAKGSARFTGAPRGGRRVRPCHLSPMAPSPPARKQQRSCRHSCRRDPD